MLAHRTPQGGEDGCVPGTRGTAEPGGTRSDIPRKGGGGQCQSKMEKFMEIVIEREPTLQGHEKGCVSFPICLYFSLGLIARVTST